ncbi:MAG: 2-C-methyl-D-erythritol 4-phosphate cytidylyltransferase [Rubrivivax sp.]
MSTAPRCFALVPCAGLGLRAGGAGPKQYALLAGRPLVWHTLDALAAVRRLTATLVVLAADDNGFEAALPGFVAQRGWLARCGGATRAATVSAGLAVLRERGAAERDWVLVHDAARCLLEPAWVDRLIDGCIDDPVGGLLALPLADTLKQAAASAPDRSMSTLARDAKWLAQTPQMFRLGPLQQALQAAAERGLVVTDEASAIEAAGLQPKLVPGEIENLKLTWPGDFALAERWLHARSASATVSPTPLAA